MPIPPIPKPPVPKIHTIPVRTLNEGRFEHTKSRAETLAHTISNYTAAPIEGFDRAIWGEDFEDESPEHRMHNLSLDMQNPELAAEDQGGFLNTLGTILEPLKYLDVPMELGWELLLDPIEAAIPGENNLSWLGGTADREIFEGWKAVGKLMRGETTLIDAADEIAWAFEKRPFIAQMALGFGYGFGVPGAVGRIRNISKFAQKSLVYTLDPANVIWDAGVFGIKKSYKGMSNLGILPKLGTEAFSVIDQKYIAGDKEYVEDAARVANGNVVGDTVAVTKLSKIHNIANSMVRMKRALRGETGEGLEFNSMKDAILDTPMIIRSRDNVLMEFQSVTAARPGHIENMTVKEFNTFIDKGLMTMKESAKPGGKQVEIPVSVGDKQWRAYSAGVEFRKALIDFVDPATGEKINLWEQLMENQDSHIFKSLDIDVRGGVQTPGSLKYGVLKKGEKEAKDKLILSQRLEYYNQAFKRAGVSGAEDGTLLPNRGQALRAIAATEIAALTGARPVDIMAQLGHSQGSPDEWLEYILDASPIDVTDDYDMLYGLQNFAYYKALNDNKGQGRFSFFEQELGITLTGVRAGKNIGKGVVRVQKAYTKKQKKALKGKKHPVTGQPLDAELQDIADRMSNSDGISFDGWSDSDLEELSNKIQQFATAYSKSAKATDKMQRKGLKLKGAFRTTAYSEYVDAIGSAYFIKLKNNDAVLEEVAPHIMERYKSWVDKLGDNYHDSFDVGDISLDGEGLMKEVAATLAMREKAIELTMAFERLDFRKRAILHSLKEQGWIAKKNKKWVVKDQQGIKEKLAWEEKYGNQAMYTKEEAQNLLSPQVGSADWATSYAGLAEATKKPAGQLHTHEIMTAAAYNQQVMTKARVDRYKKQSPMKDHPVHFDDIDIVLGEGLIGTPKELDNALWAETVQALERGAAGLKRPNLNMIRNAARKPLLALIVADNKLRGIELKAANVYAPPKDAEALLEGNNAWEDTKQAVEEWIGTKRVGLRRLDDEGKVVYDEVYDVGTGAVKEVLHQLLSSKGLQRDSTPKQIRSALHKAVREVPQLFGDDAHLLTQEALEYRAEIVTSVLSEHPEILRKITKLKTAAKVTAEIDPSPAVRPQDYMVARRRIADETSVTIHGRTVFADDIVGVVSKVSDISDWIKNPGKTMQKVLGLEKNEMGEIVPRADRNRGQKILRPIIGAFAGGQASVGMRAVAKIYNSRKKAYRLSDLQGRETYRDLNIMLSDGKLGFYTDEATEFQKKEIGLGATGNQFFGKIRPKEVLFGTGDKEHQVLGFADGSKMSREIKSLYQDLYNDSMHVNDWQFMQSTGDAHKDTYKLMTQVDVVLEEIPFEKLDEVYDNITDEMRSQLHLLQSVTDKADKLYGDRTGHSIPMVFRDEGKGDYLPEGRAYVPRLRKLGAKRLSKKKQNADGVTDNHRWWLEDRKVKKIRQIISKGSDESAAELGIGVMEDLPARLAQYVESIHKSIADIETYDAMLPYAQSASLGGKTIAAQKQSLNAFRKVFQSRNAGRIALLGSSLEDVAALREADVSWMSEELRNHHKELNVRLRGKSAVGYAQEHASKIDELISEEFHKLNALNDLIGPVKLTEGLTNVSTETHAWIRGIGLTPDEVSSIQAHHAIASEGLKSFPASLAKTSLPAARWMRTFKAGFDFGVLLIHGLNSLTLAPSVGSEGIKWTGQKAWFQGLKRMAQFVKDPDFYDTFMAQEGSMEIMRESSRFVTYGHSEPLAAVQNSNAFERARMFLTEKGVKGRVAHRAETAFVGTLDVIRMELWKGLRDTVKRQYNEQHLLNPEMFPAWQDDIGMAGKAQTEAMHDLGAAVNKMTGVYDQDIAGLTPTQGVIENAFLFFAPMYRRASYGIMADLFRSSKIGDRSGWHGLTGQIKMSGIRRNLAARQIAGLATAGFLMASLSEHILGNDGASDPSTGNFGKVEVGGVKMGFGGAFYSLARLGGDLFTGAEAAPDKDIKELIYENPILDAIGRRGRSQLSPVGSFLVDMMVGSSYIGDPLRDADGTMDWSKTLSYAGRHAAMPFWLDGAFSAERSAPLAMFSELIGMQAWPVSDYDKVVRIRKDIMDNNEDHDLLNSWRKQRLDDNEELNWHEMPLQARYDMETGHDELITAMHEYKEKWGKIARGDDRMWVNYSQAKGNIDLDSQQQLSRITTKFEQGTVSGRDLVSEISRIKRTRAEAHQRILRLDEFQGVNEAFAEKKTELSEKDYVFQGDLMYDLYQTQVMDNPELLDENGEFMYDRYEELVTAFKANWNLNERPELWNYISDYKSRWFENNPIVKELEESRELLKPYWNVHKTLFHGNMLVLANEYLSTPSERRKALLRQKDSRYTTIARSIAASRKEMRFTNPLLDWTLTKFHNARPLTNYGRMMEANWVVQQDMSYMNKTTTSPDPNKFSLSAAGYVLYNKQPLFQE